MTQVDVLGLKLHACSQAVKQLSAAAPLPPIKIQLLYTHTSIS